MASLDDHARAGLKAIEDERFEDAIQAFEQALAIDPDRPDLNNALGMSHLHRGDAGNAIPHLQRACALAEPYTAPEHVNLKREFHLSLATAYQLMDRVAEARDTLRDLIRWWPDGIEVRLQLGQLLLGSCQLSEGLSVYREVGNDLDKEQRKAAEALVGTIEAFLDSDHPASTFLLAHAESYRAYFDEIASTQAEHGWYAEAARMAVGEDGEPRPALPEGARPYAFMRVDLVNPSDGTVSGVYSETEPMVVALDGLDPLATVPILIPWEEAAPFEVWVSSRCPWHWLSIVVQFRDGAPPEARTGWIDELIGGWYLAGYNGEFGEQESGRFHYITDPDPVGDRAVAYTVDLGRARYDAIPALLRRLTVLHDRHPVQRVLFGQGRLPD